MPSSIVLKAKGLDFSPNALTLPNGSMSTAKNVVIRSEDAVEQRRGFKLYGDSFGTSSDRVSQLFAYKERILRQYGTTLQYDSTGSGTFSSFNGSYTVAQSGLRTKSIESNGNFYFTSSEGIKAISAASASDFTTSSGFIVDAGVPKAIDFKAEVIDPSSGSTGFLAQDSTVAYRTAWAIKDANSNLKISSPSQPVAVYNSLLSLLIEDYSNVLIALDNVAQAPVGSFFGNATNYVNTLKVASSASASTLRTNLLALATAIDNDIRFANDTGTGVPLTIEPAGATAMAGSVCTIEFTGSPTIASYFTVGQTIYLSGFVMGTSGSINGLQTITAVDDTADTITFNATAAGTITITGASIRSYEYRNISQPAAPSTTPTAAEVLALQTYLEAIISRLQSEDTDIISSGNDTAYITPLSTTETVNVRLTVQIPDDITTSNFLQIYRSTSVEATGTDVFDDLVANSEECQLVYEAYPTSAEISAGEIIVDDITPDIFKGANLYTNVSTGEGILQANDIPPFALDINKFKNTTFYANTKTRHRIIPFSLLGVSNMITDYDASTTPTITISNGTAHNTYTFVKGRQEVRTIVCGDKASLSDGDYFTIYSANDETGYYVWYDKSGAAVDPAVSGKTGIKVLLTSASFTTSTHVAERTRDALASVVADFTATNVTNTITATNVNYGYCTNAADGAATTGFTITTTVEGRGERASTYEILLSDETSVATAVDDTARSMVRVINANSSEIIYAFYISTLGQVPGKMVLEARSLSDTAFYIIGNNANTGASFFPNIAPTTILGVSAGRISVANPTVITSSSHGLTNGTQIVITNSNSTPSVNGLYTVTSTGANTFTIPVNVTVAGTKLSYSTVANTEVSTNEDKANRIYYSKSQQPESVPIVNYLDVGAEDKEILRIFPLRDSLFVFKEDGLFRISGEAAPFYVSLFDSSCICIAADSVSVANNLLYAYTRQGISTVSEAGVTTISREIDTEILKISSAAYSSFGTATWGVGYESDNSYTVFTVQETDDTAATIGYRYSNLTDSWTTVDKDSVCGILNPADDKIYLGAGDTNYIEIERKTFSRLDYADREITSTISNGAYVGSEIALSSVSDLDIGDVVVQEQYLTPFKYNALLSKLDIDPTVAVVSITAISGASTTLTITAASHNLVAGDYVTIQNNTSVPNFNDTYEVVSVSGNDFVITIDTPLTTVMANGTARLNYHDTLEAVAGDNLRTKLTELVAKLDTDPGLALTDYTTLIAAVGTLTISSNTAAAATVITTSASHGLYSGRYVTISGDNSSPTITGSHVATRTGANTFTIPVTVTTAGTAGSVTVDEESFLDIKGCFNLIVGNLNTDTGAAFSNYRTITDSTSIESVITDINTSTKKITLLNVIDFVVGPIIVHKAIESIVVYSPNTMGDPLGLKHLREASIMFGNKAFTSGTLSFSTDLLPSFNDVDFNASGNGIFGSGNFGSGFFGGAANSAPFRTYIPRNSQRCRYIVVKFKHKIAREDYIIYGITLTGSVGQSTRAYR